LVETPWLSLVLGQSLEKGLDFSLLNQKLKEIRMLSGSSL
jgi:hypothetical protein